MLKDFEMSTVLEIALGVLIGGIVLALLQIVLNKWIEKLKSNFEVQ